MAKAIGALAVLLLLAGCYEYLPIAAGTQPLLGQPVAMDITDAGRVALGGSIGPEIAQVEGRVVRNDAAEYELAVTTVHLLRGGEQVWAGERVTLRKEYVSRMYEKHLSKGRTAVASAAGAGVIAWFVTRKIIGSGLGEDTPMKSDSADSQRRPVRPKIRP